MKLEHELHIHVVFDVLRSDAFLVFSRVHDLLFIIIMFRESTHEIHCVPLSILASCIHFLCI